MSEELVDYSKQIEEELALLQPEESAPMEQSTSEIEAETQAETHAEKEIPNGYMDESTYLKRHGSLDGFKTKEKFDADASFFKKIDSQNKKIDELKEVLHTLVEHNKKLDVKSQKAEKIGYEKAMKELTLKKMEKIQEGDVEAVLSIEQEQANLSSAHTPVLEESKQPVVKPPSADIVAFQEKHASWMKGTSPEDKRMQIVLGGMVNNYLQTNPDIDEKIAIKEIEAELTEMFPHRFENKNINKPVVVAKSTTSAGNKSGSSFSQLSKDEQDFLKSAKFYDPNLNVDEMAKQLLSTRGI